MWTKKWYAFFKCVKPKSCKSRNECTLVMEAYVFLKHWHPPPPPTTISVPFHPPPISHEISRDWTQGSLVRSQQLSILVTTQKCSNICQQWWITCPYNVNLWSVCTSIYNELTPRSILGRCKDAHLIKKSHQVLWNSKFHFQDHKTYLNSDKQLYKYVICYFIFIFIFIIIHRSILVQNHWIWKLTVDYTDILHKFCLNIR
jgi:hypothetical protein